MTTSIKEMFLNHVQEYFHNINQPLYTSQETRFYGSELIHWNFKNGAATIYSSFLTNYYMADISLEYE